MITKKIKQLHLSLLFLLVVSVIIFLTITFFHFVTKNEFTKGVLVLNTNKSVYSLNERVEIGLASLDSQGETLCHSNLELSIKDPTGKKTTLSTANAQIVNSSTCSEDNNVTNDPDYQTHFLATDEGTYQLELKNLDTGKKISTKISVENNAAFSLARSGATRVNPFKSERYPMTITLTAKADFSGKIVEQIPAVFNVIWQGNSRVEQVGEVKTITWEVDLKAGESKELIYEYQSPKISPEFYTLGEAELISNGQTVFTEKRKWQIASDFACTSNLSGGTGNWGTAGTWSNCNSTTPQTTDSVTITAGDTVTLNASPSITFITINGTLAPDASNRTLTLTNTTTSQVTMGFGASGSVSTTNASTVVINGNASWTTTPIISGNATAYNLTFSPALGGARTYTISSNLTLAGNLTSSPTASVDRTLTINMEAATGTTQVAGTVTLSGTGCTTTDTSAAHTTLAGQHSGNFYAGFINAQTNGEICILDFAGSSATVWLTGTSGTLFTNPNASSFIEGTTSLTVAPASGSPTIFSNAETVYDFSPSAGASNSTIYAGANITIGRNLAINGGKTYEVNSTYTTSVTGITTVNGNFTLSSSGSQTFQGAVNINNGGTLTRSNAAVTSLFIGKVTIANGGTWATSNDPPVVFRGGLENNGTFNSGTGTHTFNTNGQTVSGSSAISFGGVVAISGAITIQNSNTNTVTVSGNLTGDNASSTWQNNANATTDFKATVLSTGVLTATANPNTIIYSGSSAQTLKTMTYHHLQIAHTGTVTNTLPTGTLTVAGNLTIGNGSNATTALASTNDPNITVTGNVEVTSGSTFTNSDSGSATLNIDGNLTITGTFTAPVGTNDTSFTLAGNFTKTGTFNNNSGQMTLDTTGTSELNYASNTTFYQFSVLSAASGKTVKFDNTESTIITNDITIQGTNCTTGRIFLDSTVNDDAWVLNINTGTTQNIDYVDLEDADATGSQVTPIADNATETGSNTNWTVNAGACAPGISLSGTIYQTDEATAYQCLTSGNLTVFIRVNGLGSYSATCNADTGAWSVAGVSVNSGDTVYIYTSAGSARANTILVSDASTKIDVHLMQNRVTLRDDVNASITNTEILAGNTGDGDDLITTTGTDVVIASTYETHIYTSDAYAPGTNVSSGKLHVVGNYSGSSETLTLTGSGTSTARPLYINGGTFTAPTTTNFQGSSATDIEATTFVDINLTPTISGNIDYTFLGAETINGNLTINPSGSNTLTVKLGGTTNVAATKLTDVKASGSANSILDTITSHALSTGSLSIAAGGTLDANDSTITLTGTSGTIFTRTGTFDVSGGTSTVTYSQTAGDTTLTSGSVVFDNLTINMAGFTGTLGNTVTVNDTLTVTAGTLAASVANNAMTLKDVSIGASGIFYGRGATIGVTGNWINNGSYTYGTSTVNFNGAGAQQLSGNTTFYGLAMTGSSARAITFVHDSVTGIADSGSLTLTGDTNELLTLQSDTGTAWYLRVSPTSTTVSVSHVNVSRSNAGGYKQIDASNGTNTNGGNNINWKFSSSTEIKTNFEGINMQGININTP